MAEKNSLEWIKGKIRYHTDRLIVRLQWLFFLMSKNSYGLSDENYGKELIVTVTSYPARIKYVSKAVRSIMTQRTKPNRIVLWLANENFTNKEKDLPLELLKLKKYGLEIRWCEDVKSYKKLIPALREFDDAIFITVDDDTYYRSTMIEQLIESYKKDSSIIWAHRITKIVIEDGDYRAIAGGRETWDAPTYLHKLTGAGGVLYPGNVFYKDILNEQIFRDVCTTNDDIWFWLMAVLNGTKTAQVAGSKSTMLLYVGNSQKGETLCKINDGKDNLFWRDFRNMLLRYPEVDAILRKEFTEMTSEVTNVSQNDRSF